MASSRGRRERIDGIAEREERFGGEGERTVSRAASRTIAIREVDLADALARER